MLSYGLGAFIIASEFLHRSLQAVTVLLLYHKFLIILLQILDGETIREWMQPAYKYADGTGFGYPWELKPLGDYVLRTKDGAINGYNAEFQMAVSVQAPGIPTLITLFDMSRPLPL